MGRAKGAYRCPRPQCAQGRQDNRKKGKAARKPIRRSIPKLGNRSTFFFKGRAVSQDMTNSALIMHTTLAAPQRGGGGGTLPDGEGCEPKAM